MPNFCFTELDITGTQADDVIDACVRDERPARYIRELGNADQYFDLEAITPIPDDVRRLDSDAICEWAKENWGTGKLATGCELALIDGGYNLFMVTAWGPPLVALETLLRRFTDVQMNGWTCDEWPDFAERLSVSSHRTIERESIPLDAPETLALIERYFGLDEPEEGA